MLIFFKIHFHNKLDMLKINAVSRKIETQDFARYDSNILLR